MDTTGLRSLRAGAAVAALLALAACAGGGSGEPPVEYRGTAPGQQGLGPAGISGEGVVDYDGYQAARAREGDTVASVAARLGLSASELGAYNGLSPNHPLREGDELVLPPSPNGSSAVAGGTTVASGPEPDARPIEAAPLDGGLAPPDGSQRAEAPDTASAAPGDGSWSPDLAAAAIERATGIDEDGNLAAPPSANDPLPDNPPEARQLEQPDLGQYQSPAPADPVPVETPAAEAEEAAEAAEEALAATGTGTERTLREPEARPETGSVEVDPNDGSGFQPAPGEAGDSAAEPAPESDTRVAAATPAAAPEPAASGSGRLQRPVAGPVALGFGQGSGGLRNEGVDFAAQPGAPVVAAEAGEVALVSQALGGLGTIVLLRHEDELLTVYGRIADVTVSKGEIVSRGQQIGVVARPEPPAEARMHFEVRQGADPVDPMAFLGG